MRLAVDHVLESRRRLGRRTQRGGILGSIVLHGGFITAVLVTPLLEPELEAPPRFVSVAIVPVQALGVTDPQPTRPTPSPPTSTPTKTETPKRPKPEAQREPEPPTPAAASDPGPSAVEPRRRQGSPTGSATGTATMGARVGFDNPNFRHSYYVDRMTAMLSSQWQRPAIGGEPLALVHFRIHRDGRVSDVSIIESSGYSSYDLAALRAVQQASPFPPLPQSFPEPSLGVTVEFI